MKIICPDCGKEINEEEHDGVVNCSNCGGSVRPKPLSEQEEDPAVQLKQKIDAIKSHAGLLIGIGIGAIIVGFLIAAANIVTDVSGEKVGRGYLFACAFIGLGLWLYLIGQIVHIRGNTEK
jgi:DNA-directed RNA polymerase subunit RPC12/RpoP